MIRMIAWAYLGVGAYFSYLMAVQMFNRSLAHAQLLSNAELLKAFMDAIGYFAFYLTANPLAIFALLAIVTLPKR
tara:strand:+ start:284 stop:508 length:225 start_codon:yes stop_codon:yes gene_type:complete